MYVACRSCSSIRAPIQRLSHQFIRTDQQVAETVRWQSRSFAIKRSAVRTVRPQPDRIPFRRPSPFGFPDRIDEYAWMENKESAKVLSHLALENKFAAQVDPTFNISRLNVDADVCGHCVKSLADVKHIADTLYEEMAQRVDHDRVSAPEQDGPYFYYTKVRLVELRFIIMSLSRPTVSASCAGYQRHELSYVLPTSCRLEDDSRRGDRPRFEQHCGSAFQLFCSTSVLLVFDIL